MKLVFVTFEKLSLSNPGIEVKLLQPLNILLTSVTFEKSSSSNPEIEVKLPQPSNIPLADCT